MRSDGLSKVALALALSTPQWTASAQIAPSQSGAAQSSDLSQVSAWIRQGRLDLAENRLHKFLAQRPHSTEALNLLGVVYLREKRYGEAEKTLRLVVETSPRRINAWRSLAESCNAEGKTEAARVAYERVIRNVSNDTESNLALAELYQKNGQFKNSLEAANRIEPAKRPLSLLPILAADYLGLSQTEKATIEIRAILQVADKNPDLVPQLAEFLLERGAVADTEQLLLLAETRQLQTDRFLLDVARVQDQKGNRKEARATLAKIIERSPENVDALVEAGRLAGIGMDWAPAAVLLGKAVQLAPRRLDILRGLAIAQLYSSQPKMALETAKLLEALQPDDPSTFYFMSLALIGTGQWNEARPYAEKMLSGEPENREANLAFAVISYNLNDFEEAKKRVNLCLRLNKSDPGALFYLGLIQKTLGDTEDAIKTLERSLAANFKNADAQSTLGGLYLQKGDLAHAREALEQAVQLMPQEAQNHYQLGLIYMRLGQSNEAREQMMLFQRIRAQHLPYPPVNTAPAPPPSVNFPVHP